MMSFCFLKIQWNWLVIYNDLLKIAGVVMAISVHMFLFLLNSTFHWNIPPHIHYFPFTPCLPKFQSQFIFHSKHSCLEETLLNIWKFYIRVIIWHWILEGLWYSKTSHCYYAILWHESNVCPLWFSISQFSCICVQKCMAQVYIYISRIV